MRIVCFILAILVCFSKFSFSETLFENPIEFTLYKECNLDEFCSKYIDDIDIEAFIKREIKNDYVVVSLDECIDVALKNNFKIQINDKIYQSSRYEYHNALSKFLPVLETTSYLSDFSGQILVGGVLRDVIHETALSVNITAQHYLTEGGKQIFEAKAKKYFERSKRHNLFYTRSEVIYYTSRYYYEMLLAKINIEIYLRNLIERNAQLALAKNLQNSGFGTRFDVIRSENESAQAKVSLLRALNDFKISQTRLANLMGINLDTALMPFEKDIKPIELVDDDSDINHLYEIALKNREDLKSYSDLISYEKQVKNVYITDFIPKPLINFQEQFQGTLSTSVKPNYIVSAFLTWSPGENLAIGTITKIKAQKEKIKQRILEFQDKLREIEENLTEAQSTSIFNKKEMLVNKTRVDYSKESIKLAMLRFHNGKGILLDVIQAQSEMTQARVQYVNSIIRYNISQIELAFLLGIISDEMIIENYKP